LAFAIDTWWEEHREVAAQRAQLHSLLDEFNDARGQLESQLRGLENSLRGTIQFLELMDPTATNESLQGTRMALRDSLDIGVFSPPHGTLNDVLASRGNVAFGNTDMWALLQGWPIILRDLEIDSRHLESNREERFVDALVRLGVPMSELIRAPASESQDHSPLHLPESELELDVSTLLRDPGVNTVFTMRAVRSQILLQSHEDAIQIADEIIALLEGLNQ
jgi:hypothetical protein